MSERFYVVYDNGDEKPITPVAFFRSHSNADAWLTKKMEESPESYKDCYVEWEAFQDD